MINHIRKNKMLLFTSQNVEFRFQNIIFKDSQRQVIDLLMLNFVRKNPQKIILDRDKS